VELVVDLDVVIVNWNAGAQLLDCLVSVEALLPGSVYKLSNCIVVDNASSDSSADKLVGFSFDPVVIRNHENKGFAAACNQGARIGESKYILFLNPDIKLFSDSLTKATFFGEQSQNEQIGILGIQLIDDTGIVQRNAARFPTPWSLSYQMIGLDRLWPARFPPYVMTDWNHQENREVDQVQGAFFLVRRRVFEELGGFDERFFMYHEDVDFSFRARLAGWKSYYLADVQAFHRGGGTSDQIKARRLFYWMTSRLQYVAKHFGVPAALKILIGSLLLEFWARVVGNLINLSGRHLIETIQAYVMLISTLPKLFTSLD
jgi:N-acetylglucosaminyl-diphospho-decaprenol L-rhamnosyltransferase